MLYIYIKNLKFPVQLVFSMTNKNFQRTICEVVEINLEKSYFSQCQLLSVLGLACITICMNILLTA